MRKTLTFLLSIGCWLVSHPSTQAQTLQLLSTTTPSSPQGPLDALAAPNRLYVADGGVPSALRIYDTSQPTALQLLGSLTGIVRPRRLAVNGTKVYISSIGGGGSTDSQLYAVDASNAAAPSIIRQATLLPSIARLAASGNLVCAVTSPTVYIFDSNLNLLSTFLGTDQGLVLNGNYLYLLENTSLRVFDLSVPTTPVLLNTVNLNPAPSSTTTGSVNGVVTTPLIMANNYLYINGYSKIFSLSNPALPTPVSVNSPTFSRASGPTAYQLNHSTTSSIAVVDLRVPTAPVVAATASYDSPVYSITDPITGIDDLVYALQSSGGQIKTYRYTAGVLATRDSAPSAFGLYPSPATDEVTLELAAPAAAGQRVAVRNVSGQLVLEQALSTGSTRAVLSLATLPAGLYLVQSGATTQKLLRQ